tara:strand:+ start:2690 stop:3601 length:912 start_codon:yes stop_codon:yes gene_type:complete
MPISDYLPGDCLPKAEDITPGGKKIIEQVMNGTAFKNPMAGKTTEITGKLNEAIGNLDPVVDNKLIEDLEAINSFMSEFNSHQNTLTGVGNVQEFSKRIGLAGGMNRAKETLEGGGEDYFKQMFGSVIEGGKIQDKLIDLSTQIAQGAASGTDVGDLITQATNLKGQLDTLKANDDAFVGKAINYAVRKGLGQGIGGILGENGDCFGKAYLQEFAASDALKNAAADAAADAQQLAISIDPTIAESDGEQQAVLDQRKAASTETKVTGLELSVQQNTTNIQKLANVDAEILDKNDDIDGGTYTT